MKTIWRIFVTLLLIPASYVLWANNKWDPAESQTGVMENCRWQTNEGVKTHECLIRLSNDELVGVVKLILDDDSHREVTLKVEVNKLRKKRKRYTFIGSS